MSVEQGMGPGTGNWGLLEAKDEESATALIRTAEQWLRDKGMTRVLGPLSISIWEEPGLLVQGHAHPPPVIMGHNSTAYQSWKEAMGYNQVNQIKTYARALTNDLTTFITRYIPSRKNKPNR